MRVINDPLDQTYSSANSDHYSRLNLFCEILKSGDGRTDGQTAHAKIVITTGRNWGVGLVDQYIKVQKTSIIIIPFHNQKLNWLDLLWTKMA